MIFITVLIHFVLILLSVAFFTLFERKVIGLFHLRVGPNKVSFYGLVQPLLDAFKLLTKQPMVPFRSNRFSYSSAPQLALFLSLLIWVTLPVIYMTLSVSYSVVVFFCVGSVIVFSVLLAGWSSNSKYSLIGRLRSVSQSVSYEAVFSTLLVLVIVIVSSYSFVVF